MLDNYVMSCLFKENKFLSHREGKSNWGHVGPQTTVSKGFIKVMYAFLRGSWYFRDSPPLSHLSCLPHPTWVVELRKHPRMPQRSNLQRTPPSACPCPNTSASYLSLTPATMWQFYKFVLPRRPRVDKISIITGKSPLIFLWGRWHFAFQTAELDFRWESGPGLP